MILALTSLATFGLLVVGSYIESTTQRLIVTSHAALSASERAATGISDGLIRVSVGIEYIRDLLADFEQALQLA